MAVTSRSFCESLDESLANTYENNATLNAAREELKEVDEMQMQALSGWFPRLSIRSKKEFVDNRRFGDLRSTVRITGSGRTDTFYVDHNFFRGGGDVAVMKVAHYNIEQMRAKLIAVEQQSLLSAVDAYMQLLQTKESYEISKEREIHTKHYVTAIKKRFEAGQNTKTDVAQAGASYAGALAQRVKSYSDYRTVSAIFLKVTGVEPTNLFVPKDNLLLPSTFEEVKNIALKQNPSLVGMINRFRMTESEVGAKIAPLLPSVDFQYSIEDNKRAEGILTTATAARLQKNTSISLNIPLFNGGASWSELRRSKRKVKKTGYELNNVRNEVVEKTVQAWEESKAAKEIYEARKLKLKASKVAYDGVVAEEKAGLRDTIDVINIRSRYFDSREELLRSRSDYFIKLYSLKAQIGECTAQYLNLKVKTHDPFKNYKKIRWQLIGDFTGD